MAATAVFQSTLGFAVPHSGSQNAILTVPLHSLQLTFPI